MLAKMDAELDGMKAGKRANKENEGKIHRKSRTKKQLSE